MDTKPDSSIPRFAFPISLDVSGRLCCVLGGGPEAIDKALRLARAGARVSLFAQQIEPGFAEQAAQEKVTWVPRDWHEDDIKEALLIVLTPEQRSRSAELFAFAAAHRCLVCCIDEPEYCTFAHPAIVKVGDLTVALSSRGRAPAVLKRLREDLQKALCTENMKRFLTAMAELRQSVEKGKRIEALQRAVQGFELSVTIRYPDWFQGGGKPLNVTLPD